MSGFLCRHGFSAAHGCAAPHDGRVQPSHAAAAEMRRPDASAAPAAASAATRHSGFPESVWRGENCIIHSDLETQLIIHRTRENVAPGYTAGAFVLTVTRLSVIIMINIISIANWGPSNLWHLLSHPHLHRVTQALASHPCGHSLTLRQQLIRHNN